MTHQNKLSELAKEANKSYTTTEDFSSNKYDKYQKKREDFLKVYFNNHCHIQKSCTVFGITRVTFHEWYKKYPDFRQKCDNVVDEMRALVDDAMIKLIVQGHPETIKDARKCLKGTSKFIVGKHINYNLKKLKTLDEIKETRLRAIADFGNGVIDQDTVEIINELLDSLVDNIMASDGMRLLNKIKAMIEENKKIHG